MAQSWRKDRAGGGFRPPLDRPALERLALRYVERFATSRGRLADYLQRKVRERGWDGDDTPPISSVVERLAALGCVDDAAFAVARAENLSRRGYGARRVAVSLKVARIGAEEASAAQASVQANAFDSALTFARRKRIGPYALAMPDRAGREKAIAAMLRAGHRLDMARAIVDSPPGRMPAWHDDEG